MNRDSRTIKTQKDREDVIACVRNAPFGTTFEVRGPRRSLDQNALLWSLLGQISRHVNWYGQHLSSEDWKDVLTASMRRTRVVPGIDAGTFVPLGMRTSQMSKAELSDLLELIIAFGTEHGVKFREFEDVAA
jgi:hypothetical protein